MIKPRTSVSSIIATAHRQGGQAHGEASNLMIVVATASVDNAQLLQLPAVCQVVQIFCTKGSLWVFDMKNLHGFERRYLYSFPTNTA